MSAASTLALTHATPALQLAAELDDNKVTPGILGFIVFALIGGAVWLLMKSMTKHMKKVDFEERPTREPRSGETPAQVPAPKPHHTA